MATFNTPQTIHLTSNAIERASAFADAVTATVNYRDSNQSIKEKIRDDHFVSKLGEEAVRLVFEERKCQVQGPDYNVYAGKGKSWEADLKVNGLDVAVSSQKTESALRLLRALGWSWEVRGHYNEARDWLDKIHTLPGVSRYPELHAQILNHVGRYFWTQGNVSFARAKLEESWALSSQLGKNGIPALAETLNWLGLLVLFNDEDGKERARPMFQQGLDLYTSVNDTWGMALSIFHKGIMENELRNNDLAFSLFEQSYEKFEELGDVFFMGRVSLFLGYLYFDLEDRGKSHHFFEEHLRLDSSLKFWNGCAEALRDLGKWHEKYGTPETAQGYFEQCRTICREHGLAPFS